MPFVPTECASDELVGQIDQIRGIFREIQTLSSTTHQSQSQLQLQPQPLHNLPPAQPLPQPASAPEPPLSDREVQQLVDYYERTGGYADEPPPRSEPSADPSSIYDGIF